MPRLFFLALVLTVSLAGILTLPALPSTVAQEGTPPATTGHAVVGAWRFDTNAEDPANPPSYAIFHADGTYLELHQTVGPGIGTWRPTGERTVDLTIVFADVDLTEAGFSRGELAVHATVELDERGNALTAPYTFAGTDLDGSVLFEGALTATATRISAAPMVPLGTPVATPAP